MTTYAIVIDIPNDTSFHPYVTSIWDTEEQALDKAHRDLEQHADDVGIDDPEMVTDDVSARITRVKAHNVGVVAYVENAELGGDAL